MDIAKTNFLRIKYGQYRRHTSTVDGTDSTDDGTDDSTEMSKRGHSRWLDGSVLSFIPVLSNLSRV